MEEVYEKGGDDDGGRSEGVGENVEEDPMHVL
jgi:hypothetical protein